MKKIAIYFLTALLAFDLGMITSHASEKTEISSIEDSDASIYGEMENGLFIKTIQEEVAHISKDDPSYFDEYYKALEAHKLDSLTPEMEQAGYQLVNGIAYSQEELDFTEGDPGEAENVTTIKGTDVGKEIEITEYDESGNPIVSYGNGYVTFASTVHPDIHETCYIEVTNITSNKIYSFEVYEQNDYKKSIQLPSGSYIVSGGGLKNDFISEYPISNDSFEVTAGATSIVNITIGNITEEEKAGVIIVTQEETVTDEPKEIVVPEKKGSSIFSFIIEIVVMLALAGTVIYFVKKRNR